MDYLKSIYNGITSLIKGTGLESVIIIFVVLLVFQCIGNLMPNDQDHYKEQRKPNWVIFFEKN